MERSEVMVHYIMALYTHSNKPLGKRVCILITLLHEFSVNRQQLRQLFLRATQVNNIVLAYYWQQSNNLFNSTHWLLAFKFTGTPTLPEMEQLVCKANTPAHSHTPLQLSRYAHHSCQNLVNTNIISCELQLSMLSKVKNWFVYPLLPWPMLHPSIKFHQNQAASCFVILLTDKHQTAPRNITSFVEVIITNLTGEESLEAEDVGWGLDGAENIGQEGERGEVGLGDVALMNTYTQNMQFKTLAVYIHTVLNIISCNILWHF